MICGMALTRNAKIMVHSDHIPVNFEVLPLKVFKPPDLK